LARSWGRTLPASAMVPPDRRQVAESITTFVAAAEAHERDTAPEAVSVAAVAEVSRDAFAAAVCGAPPVRGGGPARPWASGAAGVQDRLADCALDPSSLAHAGWA
jgi:hypothetical protein